MQLQLKQEQEDADMARVLQSDMAEIARLELEDAFDTATARVNADRSQEMLDKLQQREDRSKRLQKQQESKDEALAQQLSEGCKADKYVSEIGRAHV